MELTRQNFSIQTVIEKAIDSGNLEIVERLLTLQEKTETRSARQEFHKSLQDFKAEGVRVFKNARSHNSNYTTLDNLIASVTPILSKHMLNLTWRISTDNNQISVTAVLSHYQGHSESTTMSSPPDTSGKKNPIQAMASTKSYLERYTAMAILGIAASDMDDDGVRAMNEPTITEKQEVDLQVMIESKGKTIEDFLSICKINKLSDLTVNAYEAWLKKLG